MYDVMYGSVTNTCVKENPCMVLIPSSVSKSTGKYCLMKHCMVTLPFPILKSKGKYCMAEKPSHVSRVSLSYPVEIGLNSTRCVRCRDKFLLVSSTQRMQSWALFVSLLFRYR
jgi:hypothetical protein